MHKTLMSAAIGSALLLAGCEQVTTEQIQAATVQACSFLPTAVIISSFIPGVAPYSVTAGSVATAICEAVKQAPPQARRRGAAPISVRVNVNGTTVSVTGHFVRR